jgi:TatD DNase family protein
MIDTHAHLYLDDFQGETEEVIHRSLEAGIEELWLPAISASSLPAMHQLDRDYPGLFRLFAGLHPEEVKDNYTHELTLIENAWQEQAYQGIGEIGLDFYWDRTYVKEQLQALNRQLDWAVSLEVPVILHVREAFETIMPLIRTYYGKPLRGIFHSFAGGPEEAAELTSTGQFLLGINGTITFRKSPLAEFLSQIPLRYLVTETDAPYLTPVPFRGKRNEPSYIPFIIDKLASIYGLPAETVKQATAENAKRLLYTHGI